MNDFPKIGIRTDELRETVDTLIAQAFELRGDKSQDFGAVNWGDIGVVDIEYRLSMLRPDDGPSCVVLIEEASPDCGLPRWLYERLDKTKYPHTYFETLAAGGYEHARRAHIEMERIALRRPI